MFDLQVYMIVLFTPSAFPTKPIGILRNRHLPQMENVD